MAVLLQTDTAECLGARNITQNGATTLNGEVQDNGFAATDGLFRHLPSSSDIATTRDVALGRLVLKDGRYNISTTRRKVGDRRMRLLADLFTTMVDMRWRYNVILFIGVFLITWIGFALLWYGVLRANGDHLHINDTDWKPCISNVYDFSGAVFFSVDLQSTLGYGYSEIQSACPAAIFIFMFQCWFGVLIECLATAVVFTKLIRPKRRNRTIMFSREAVIFPLENGIFVFQFRVADVRNPCLVSTFISAVLARETITDEGEYFPFGLHQIDLKTEMGVNNSLDLLFPETVSHVIDSTSPLFGLTPDGLKEETFEIIVILEGTDNSTGMVTQFRSSYLPKEIRFGYRFVDSLFRHLVFTKHCHAADICRHLANERQHAVYADYSLFDAVIKDFN